MFLHRAALFKNRLQKLTSIVIIKLMILVFIVIRGVTNEVY
jgi:hypothetical protein